MKTSPSIALVLFLGLYFAEGQDVELALAQKNLEGYPSGLLFDSISTNRNEARSLDKAKVSELLESKEVRDAVTRAALEYSAQMLNQSGQARYMFSDPGMCEYSWVSWLPWVGCDAPETKQANSALPLIMESSYSCYHV